MATLATTNPTLADWAKRQEYGEKIPVIAELLSQTNEIVEDAVVREANSATAHRVVIRTGLPTVYWRSLNQGIPNSKSTTAQVDESMGMLEARSEVDKDLALLNGDVNAFRMSEDSAFIEAMGQTQATAMFYGNPATDPKQYLGLAPRYSSLSAGNAANILSAGGAGSDNTSVWLVAWGDNTVFTTFPKGSTAGLYTQDLGEQTVYNADGTRLQAFASRYQWKNGLVVKDWRYVVRIANIDVSDLIGQTGTQASTASTNLLKLMLRAFYRLPQTGNVRMAFYMNRTVHSGLAMAALDKSQNVLNVQSGMTQFGKPNTWTSFLGVPLRKVDALLNAEAVVS